MTSYTEAVAQKRHENIVFPIEIFPFSFFPILVHISNVNFLQKLLLPYIQYYIVNGIKTFFLFAVSIMHVHFFLNVYEH